MNACPQPAREGVVVVHGRGCPCYDRAAIGPRARTCTAGSGGRSLTVRFGQAALSLPWASCSQPSVKLALPVLPSPPDACGGNLAAARLLSQGLRVHRQVARCLGRAPKFHGLHLMVSAASRCILIAALGTVKGKGPRSRHPFLEGRNSGLVDRTEWFGRSGCKTGALRGQNPWMQRGSRGSCGSPYRTRRR
jgi:hypothetical protein